MHRATRALRSPGSPPCHRCRPRPRSPTATTTRATSTMTSASAPSPRTPGPQQRPAPARPRRPAGHRLRTAPHRRTSSFGGQTHHLTLEPNFAVGVCGDPGRLPRVVHPVPAGPVHVPLHRHGRRRGRRRRDDVGPDDVRDVVQDHERGDVPAGRRPVERRARDELEAEAARAATAAAAAQRRRRRRRGRSRSSASIVAIVAIGLAIAARARAGRDRPPRRDPLLAHAGGADESLSLVMLFAADLARAGSAGRGCRARGSAGCPDGARYALFGVAVALAGRGDDLVPRAIFGPHPDRGRRRAAPGIDRHPALRSSRRATATSSRRPADRAIDLQGGTVTPATSDDARARHGPHPPAPGRRAGVDDLRRRVQVVDMRGLGPGRAYDDAEFVAADHLPFDPPVQARSRARWRRDEAVAARHRRAARRWRRSSSARRGRPGARGPRVVRPRRRRRRSTRAAELTLTFTETPDPSLSEIDVLDSGGSDRADGPARRVRPDDASSCRSPTDSPTASTPSAGGSCRPTTGTSHGAFAFAFGVGTPPGAATAPRRLDARSGPTPLRSREGAALRRADAAGRDRRRRRSALFGGAPAPRRRIGLVAGVAAFARGDRLAGRRSSAPSACRR